MKNFLKWNLPKSAIHEKEQESLYFHERDIWFTSCGLNVGFEEDGKGEGFARPVLVFKKFNKHIFWGVPLTKRCKEGKHYFVFQYSPKMPSCALLSQLRLFDSKRLLKKDGKISKKDYHQLRLKLRELI